jgi:L-ascorbate metabolism protein UlaG (beta-lactamase superfamily)
MNDQPLYLRPNVQVEPLLDLWYTWPHLIPPHTAARNITERHLKIMDSYISAPQVHAAAVKNPKMLGGPFIDLGGRRLDEVKSLREFIRKERRGVLELSAAIAHLDAFLQANAKGYSLQQLYACVPAVLKGYVELVYDLNNHASMRFIEPLLYRSPLYDRSMQSLRLSLTDQDDRAFALSTPRLPDENSVEAPVPFDHAGIDALFRLKTEPQPWRRVAELMPIPEEKLDRFKTFFRGDPPVECQPYEGKGVRWRYFGHACILVETQGLCLLFDPVISYSYDSDPPRYTYEDLPARIDYALITHNHQDHVLFETLLQLRHKIQTIVTPKSDHGSLQDPSVKLLLEAAGFRNVREMGEFDSIETPNGSITGLPFFGEHADLDVRSKLAYLVRAGRHKLLFAADSCNIEPELYAHVYREIGDVDALFVGMECDGAPLTWLYGPLLTQRIERAMDESRRLAGSNYEQAVDIVNRFHCREVYVYAMGQEPWLNHIMSIKYTEESRPIVESNRLIRDCRERGVQAERLFGEKEILLEP